MSQQKKIKKLENSLDDFRTTFSQLKDEIQKAIIGHDELLTEVLVAVFCRGKVLLEGVPGLGKTYLVRTLAKVMGLSPGRIQCTPDLMPADILGTHIINENEAGRRSLHFEKGPMFANLVLVDEINRATPKTQAPLLEVMQESCVTAGRETMPLPQPFFVMATQNPIEMEGTYPLPEAQADRFLFKLRVPFPDREALIEISRRTSGFEEPELEAMVSGEQLRKFQQTVTQIPIADHITAAAADLILAPHPKPQQTDAISQFVSYGASPRGLQALVRGARVFTAIDGRTAVSRGDINRVALPTLRHRMILNFQGEAEATNIDKLVTDLIHKMNG